MLHSDALIEAAKLAQSSPHIIHLNIIPEGIVVRGRTHDNIRSVESMVTWQEMEQGLYAANPISYMVGLVNSKLAQS